jgi:hypothetical protein
MEDAITPQHGLFEEPGNRAQSLEYCPKSDVAVDDIKSALDVNDIPMKMYRRGTPYGNAGDYGFIF